MTTTTTTIKKVCYGTLKPITTCRDCEIGKDCLNAYYKLNGMK